MAALVAGRSGESALLLGRVGRPEHAHARVGPELAPEQRDARIALEFSRGPITARDEGPHEELLRVLIQRVRGDEPTCQLHRPGTIPRGQPCACSLPEHALGRSSEAPAGREQPYLEAGTRRKGHTLQELLTKAGNVDHLPPGACGEGMDVDECSVRQPQNDGVAGDTRLLTEKPP